jgi:bacterioferritin-associated ferredoxin
MFVCICNGVTERQIRAAIEEGAASVHDLSARLGVATGCGCCADFAADLLSEVSPCAAAPRLHDGVAA